MKSGTLKKFLIPLGEGTGFSDLTWDLYPLVSSDVTLHLSDCGLPKIGVKIKPGMILVEKIIKGPRYSERDLPRSVEVNVFDREFVEEKYKDFWVDQSVYAEEIHNGEVVATELREKDGNRFAIIEINCCEMGEPLIECD